MLIIELTEKEEEYRKNNFPDINKIRDAKLVCSICSTLIGPYILAGLSCYLHPVLRVLVCKNCLSFYGDGNFSLDEDGDEKYCRWCAQGGQLFFCSKCNSSFCSRCIKKNLSRDFLKSIQTKKDWECFLCIPEPLYKLRAQAWAAKEIYLETKKKTTKKVNKSTPKNVGFKNNGKKNYNKLNCFKKLNFNDSFLVPDKDKKITKVGCRFLSQFLTDVMTSLEDSVKGVKHFKTDCDEITTLNSPNDVFKHCQNVNEYFAELIETILKLQNRLVENVFVYQNFIKTSTNLNLKDAILNESKIDNIQNIDGIEIKNDVINTNKTVSISDKDSSDSSNESSEKNLELTNQEENSKKYIIELSDSECSFATENNSSDGNISDLSNSLDLDLSSLSDSLLPTDENIVLKNKGEEDESEVDNEIEEKTQVKDLNKKEQKKLEEDSDDDRLLNITSLNQKHKVKQPDDDDDSEDQSVQDMLFNNETNETDKSKGKNEKKNNDDNGKLEIPMSNIDSSSDADEDEDKCNTSTDTNENLCKTELDKSFDENNFTKRFLNLSSSSNDSDSKDEPKDEDSDWDEFITNLVDKKKKTLNNVKSDPLDKKEKNDCSTSSKESDNSEENSSSSSKSSSITSRNKKSKWKHNKMLTLKLSDTDSSDEEKRRLKWKQNEEKRENDSKDSSRTSSPSGSTNNSSSDLFSDSDVDEESASSGDIFNMGNKRRISSSSSDFNSEDIIFTKKTKYNHIFSDSSTNFSEDEEGVLNASQNSAKGRKNIRKVISDDLLAEETRKALKEEQERKKRIAERQKLYNQFDEVKDTENGTIEKLVLDFDTNTKKELIVVDKNLVKKMKPHQVRGIKFMWDSCYESVERINLSQGSGCILAHCMGLGKTFQVVSLVHTLLTYSELTRVKTVLIVCPLSTALNWVGEFKSWLKDTENWKNTNIFHLSKDKKQYGRAFRLEDWFNRGGVMIIGYEMFRNLTSDKSKHIKEKNKEIFIKTLLDPGPDLVVCDEGHTLKNENTALSKAMSRLKTLRRIVLTGTPLQNNLIEYHCMMHFVKPNLLGSRKEFCNRFVNPITNGQFVDSTERDFKIMKRRAYVLHNLLEGLVQRCDYNVLTPYLPPKQEYVVSICLTDIQKKLYSHYIETVAKKRSKLKLLADWQTLSRIWSHPLALKFHNDKELKGKHKENLDNSSEEATNDTGSKCDVSSSDDSVICIDDQPHKKNTITVEQQKNSDKLNDDPEVLADTWWTAVLEPDDFENIGSSSKILLLMAILRECELIGDKVLVFSQSLYSLNLIEYFLQKINEKYQELKDDNLLRGFGQWMKDYDYFRLDGSTSADNRRAWINKFNSENNTRARLFLISTRAGGLGVNLVAANRAVIFDASWNPSWDVQSIFRIYRFGQKKPCYIYRFIAQGTMEEKVYERQIAKLSLSQRVVDEQQVNRYFTHSDLQELYKFTPAENNEYIIPVFPKDRLMADMIKEFSTLIYKCHEHDSLLDHVEEEELNEEERKAAWEDYENEKSKSHGPQMQANFTGLPGMDLPQIQNATSLPPLVLSRMPIVGNPAGPSSIAPNQRQNFTIPPGMQSEYLFKRLRAIREMGSRMES